MAWGARDSARRAKERARRERQERQREDRQTQQRSTWTPASSQPPDVGVIDGTDHHIVSFKTGGPQGDRTIIADGDYSDDRDGFDIHHNDYGSRREAPGEYFAEDRGYYSGPYH